MKLKNVFLSIVMIIALLATVFIPTNTYANNVMYFGVTEIRTKDNSNMGYGIMNPSTGSVNATKIWNVVKFESEKYANPTEGDIYCIKAGVGFSDTHKTGRYDVSIDMKNGRQRIIDQHNSILDTIESNVSHINDILEALYTDNSNYYANVLDKAKDIEKAIVTNQTVHIDADFPNAKDVHHIIEAIEGLANAAAQRANSKGY